MGLMNSGDWAAMASDLQAVRDDNAVSITIRRGNSTLAAQTVRIARRSGYQRQDSAAATQATTAVVVMGAVALDIQVDDRFTHGGLLYEVGFVRPNRRAATVAEATAIE
ncbi:MAG: hypothetical protein AB7R40_22190 [Nitrospiraceae bacterium]